jgi:hypothetical protein
MAVHFVFADFVTEVGIAAGTRSASSTHFSVLAARIASELSLSFRPRNRRGAQGRPGARCTRGLACNVHQKMRTRAYRFSGNTPAFPAQWLYGLLRALPGERLFCHRRFADVATRRNLTPAPRRQDHTTSPYAPATFVSVTSASTASHRNVPDDRDPPLSWVRRPESNH